MADAKTIAVAGGAVVALVLLERASRAAGTANRAAAEFLRTQTVAGASFSVPSSANMEETHAAMLAALRASGVELDDTGHLRQVIDLWLQAQQQGCSGEPKPPTPGPVGMTEMFTDPDFNEQNYRNYSLTADPDADADSWLTITASCDPRVACGDPSKLTRVGRAVCKLVALRSEFTLGDQQSEVLAATLELARAMDAADFTIAGDRRTDREGALPQLTDLPGRIARSALGLVGDAIKEPVILLAIAGLVAWRAFR